MNTPLQIRGAVAEYERALIADRTRRGRLAKLRAGQLLPWIHTPYGYRCDPQYPRDPTRLRIEETEASIVRQMFSWYADEGPSIHTIAARLMTLGIPTYHGGLHWHPRLLSGASSATRCMRGSPMGTGTMTWSRSAGVVGAPHKNASGIIRGSGRERNGLRLRSRRFSRGSSSNACQPYGHCGKFSRGAIIPSMSICYGRESVVRGVD